MCNPIPAAAPHARSPLLLCYITDRKQFSGTPAEQELHLLERITQCSAAGVDYIQLREKDLSTRELEALASKAVGAIPGTSATKLLVNSRIDVALACGAHGVHLPGDSLSPSEARAIFAQAGTCDAVIGISTHSISEIIAAESHGADFAVFGPVFEKSGVKCPNGLQLLVEIGRRFQAGAKPMPVLALGGVTQDNAVQCLNAGAAGIAAIRLFQQNDVAVTVERLRRLSRAGSLAAS